MCVANHHQSRKWIDAESYVLLPAALGLFTLGTCGLIGTDDLLACFTAGCCLNWDGEYLKECEIRHDEVNSCIDVILNFGGFMYIGAVLPWSEFNDPTGTGITWGRLMGFGFLVLLFRRLPAILGLYKLMPAVCANWKEALFMGYFGPIGIGGVFYVEHARHLFPHAEDAIGDDEVYNMLKAMGPAVYWLVFFSIVIHGLSIPAMSIYYHYLGAEEIKDDAIQVRRASIRAATPVNAMELDPNTFVAYNRFHRPGSMNMVDLPVVEGMRSARPSIQIRVDHREAQVDSSSSSSSRRESK